MRAATEQVPGTGNRGPWKKKTACGATALLTQAALPFSKVLIQPCRSSSTDSSRCPEALRDPPLA